ncbi:ash family protein [Pantoea agglomerans]|uniref:ash family protein n=1 Tax=Enterobacter agglomerans TaxID=549 RepID=UPI003C7B2697
MSGRDWNPARTRRWHLTCLRRCHAWCFCRCVSMVALVGPPSGGPDPLYAGSSNPANVTTRRLEPPVVTLLSVQGAIYV